MAVPDEGRAVNGGVLGTPSEKVVLSVRRTARAVVEARRQCDGPGDEAGTDEWARSIDADVEELATLIMALPRAEVTL